MKRQTRISVLLCLLLWNCNTISTKEKNWNKVPEVVYAKSVIDSCNLYIPLFQIKQDSLSKVNEFEALKNKNNLNILTQNLDDLVQELEVDAKSLATEEELQSYLLRLNTQAQYVQALLASGKAIYEEHSQSFGRWTR
ncbi:hypothetical protein [Haliscomenobacter sp.]|uniref:hypothetical protein n=1 Tax=Haliscomenobacter sp. TaxID=2717303 RepID=UPI00359458FC